jgi:hypothetical protein
MHAACIGYPQTCTINTLHILTMKFCYAKFTLPKKHSAGGFTAAVVLPLC